MAKALKIAAVVVGVAALAVSAIATFGTTAFLASFAATVGASAMAVAGALSLASTVLGMAAGFLAKKPKLGSAGTQLEFVSDPSAGQPYYMGDGMSGMHVVHQASWSDKNKYLGLVGIISCAGPIQEYSGFYADGNLINIASNGEATGYYENWLELHKQLGARPEASWLQMIRDSQTMPNWGAAYKLSGLAAAGVLLKADVKEGKMFAAGLPRMMHRIKGVKAYDPRLDSTQVGGSGAHRATQEDTYTYSENPWVHHGTFAIGRWVNGVRVIGPGLPLDSVDWGAHMEAASVADFNNWKVSGRVMSTDRKWEVLKAIAQAGGGYPIPTGAKLSCLVNVPRVSLETIEEADVRGAVIVPQMGMRRDVLNGAIPRFRSAPHGWEFVPGTVVRNPDYLAADGGNERTRETEFALVVDNGNGDGKDQAAQLAAYEVANSRERSGISVELGLVWSQFKVGDCLTLNLPKARLYNQKAVVIGKGFDFERNTVTLEFRTEDDDKHEWALGVGGQTTLPPDWIIPLGTAEQGVETDTQTAQLIRNSYAASGLTVTGNPESAVDADDGTIVIGDHTRVYADKTVAITGTTLTGLAPGKYWIYYDDPTRSDTTPAFVATTVYGTSLNSDTNPYRHSLPIAVTVAAAGGSSSGGDYGGGGYGGGWDDGTDIP